ncbi:MAG: hypothetical protein LDL07_13690 [Desulfarculus sp.]|nr:hypothetical protein [Desulfarculus sp.]
MDQVNIPVWLAVFAAVGLSAERLVEVVKNRFVWLDTQNPDPQKERTRKFWLRLLTILIASGIVFAAQEQIRPYMPFLLPESGLRRVVGCLLVGLLSSAGSDFWNQAVGMLNAAKEAKRLDLAKAAAALQAGGSGPEPPA